MKKMSFSDEFQRVFDISPDCVAGMGKAVNLIVSRVREMELAGYQIERAFEDTISDISGEFIKANADKFSKIQDAAKIGLGLKTVSFQETPKELLNLKPSPKP